MESNSNNPLNESFSAIGKYLQLIMLEFKEHLAKYDRMYNNICINTKNYFNVFESIIEDYVTEINSNSSSLFDMISKLDLLADELPKIEELYFKIREMRLGLEKTYKLIKK